jgi:hypothetical protein
MLGHRRNKKVIPFATTVVTDKIDAGRMEKALND